QAYARFYAVAGKSEYGLSVQRIALEIPGAETVVQLPPERIIRGRLRDLQGQPAAGVAVKVRWLGIGKPWRPESISLGTEGKPPIWPQTALSDAEGRFVVKGIGPRMQGRLDTESERFDQQTIEIQS